MSRFFETLILLPALSVNVAQACPPELMVGHEGLRKLVSSVIEIQDAQGNPEPGAEEKQEDLLLTSALSLFSQIDGHWQMGVVTVDEDGNAKDFFPGGRILSTIQIEKEENGDETKVRFYTNDVTKYRDEAGRITEIAGHQLNETFTLSKSRPDQITLKLEGEDYADLPTLNGIMNGHGVFEFFMPGHDKPLFKVRFYFDDTFKVNYIELVPGKTKGPDGTEKDVVIQAGRVSAARAAEIHEGR